jgi:sec-independent protein translocase protein TatC
VAAVITPTGDPANMLVIAAPMVVLYVVGIGVAWVFGRSRRGSSRVFPNGAA